MDDETQRRSGSPRAAPSGTSSFEHVPAPVQRGGNAVSAAELGAFSDSPESEHLARLEADQALMFRLSLEGFGGRTWEELSRALVEYGFAVMRAWIATGVVRVKCRERGHGLSSPAAVGGLRAGDAEDLATDTVALALVDFRRRVLEPGRWDPDKGATVATFFVGNCLLQFPNLYRGWFSARAREVTTIQLDALRTSPPHPGPEVEGIGRVAAEAILGRLGGISRVVAELRAQGYTTPEIAALTGQSDRAVEGRLYRIRAQLRKEEIA